MCENKFVCLKVDTVISNWKFCLCFATFSQKSYYCPCISCSGIWTLTLILLTCRIWWAPNNASKWQMGFNLVFKGLMQCCCTSPVQHSTTTYAWLPGYPHYSLSASPPHLIFQGSRQVIVWAVPRLDCREGKGELHICTLQLSPTSVIMCEVLQCHVEILCASSTRTFCKCTSHFMENLYIASSANGFPSRQKINQ